MQGGTSLQFRALRGAGDISLWYVLAAANAVTDADLVAGTTLRAPQVTTTANDASTFKPYDPNAILGPTTPSLPYIAPPPKQQCNAVAQILMVVVAIVVTVYTAGAAAGAWGAAGTAGTAGAAGAAVGTTTAMSTMAAGTAALSGGLGATGAIAAGVGSFVGSIASQAVGKALGVVDHFSLRSAVASGLSAGITAGIGTQLGPVSQLIDKGKWGKVAASAVLSNIGSYAANKIAGVEASFSWRSVAADAVTSVVAGKINKKLGTVFKPGDSNGIVRDTVGGIVGGVVSVHTHRAFGGERQIDYGRIATDAFGNALGNAAVSKLSVMGRPTLSRVEIEQERLQIDPGKLELLPPTGLAGESLGARGGVAGAGIVPTYAMAAEAARDRARVLNSLQTLGKPLTDNQLQELIYSTHLYDDRFGQKVYETIASPVGLNSDQLEVWKAQWAEFDKGLPANHSVIVNPDTIRAAMTTAEISAAADATVARDAQLLVGGYAALAGIGAVGAVATLSPLVGAGLSGWSIGSGINDVSDGNYVAGGLQIAGGALGLGLAGSQIRSATTLREAIWMPLGPAGTSRMVSTSYAEATTMRKADQLFKLITNGENTQPLAAELAREFTRSAQGQFSDSTIIGRYAMPLSVESKQPMGYIDIANRWGGSWFETPSPFFPRLQSRFESMALEAGYSLDAAKDLAITQSNSAAFLVNEQFLLQRAATGNPFRLVNTTQHFASWKWPTSATYKEIEMLNSDAFRAMGYVKKGGQWVMVKP